MGAELIALFEESVIDVRHLSYGGRFTIGESPRADLPYAGLGALRELVRVGGGWRGSGRQRLLRGGCRGCDGQRQGAGKGEAVPSTHGVLQRSRGRQLSGRALRML